MSFFERFRKRGTREESAPRIKIKEAEPKSELVQAAELLDRTIFDALKEIPFGKGLNERSVLINVGDNTLKLVQTEQGGHGQFHYYHRLEIDSPEGGKIAIYPEQSFEKGFGVYIKKDGNIIFNSFQPDQSDEIVADTLDKIKTYTKVIQEKNQPK